MRALRILLVEDNFNFRNSAIKFINSNLRFEVLTWVSSGEEAIKKIESNGLDLVLMDISMEGINGIEAARKIRSLNKSIKIILLTMTDNNEYKNEAMVAGANDFIPKVEFSDKLIPTINNIFAGYQNKYLTD
ncbi:MAG: response regulator transcription factor [Bacteroidetes bacterium]|nr:response regulator transcription factor [Bacteroidota bacterium]